MITTLHRRFRRSTSIHCVLICFSNSVMLLDLATAPTRMRGPCSAQCRNCPHHTRYLMSYKALMFLWICFVVIFGWNVNKIKCKLHWTIHSLLFNLKTEKTSLTAKNKQYFVIIGITKMIIINLLTVLKIKQ